MKGCRTLPHAYPTHEDLQRLQHEPGLAITAYVRSDPSNDEFTRTTVNSALNTAMKQLRQCAPQLRHSDTLAFQAQINAVFDSAALTHALSTLAIFVAASHHEVHAVQNHLPEITRAGHGFALGPLLRALTTPQDAFVLTLASDCWALWQATACHTVRAMDTPADAPSDVAEATNRATTRDRSHVKRIVGDEGQKLLQERYASIVLQTMHPTIDAADPHFTTPLFIFASEPLLSMALNAEHRRPVIPVHGAPNALRANDIDATLRPLLATHNAAVARAHVAEIADSFGSDLATTDLNDIATAALSGAIDTLYFDFETVIPGTLNRDTGALTITDSGDDALTQLALATLAHGGTVRAIRRDDVPLPHNSVALAQLRFPIDMPSA